MGQTKKRQNFWHRLNQAWLRYEYKHTTIAVTVLVLFILLFNTAFMSSLFVYLESLDYLGGFIAGVLAASLITAAPALVLVVAIAQIPQIDPLTLALLVGLGSSVGDMLLLLFFEERIFRELAPIGRKLGLKRFERHRRSKRRRMSTPALLLGAFLIMTPLPDEVGIGLLGISHFPRVFLFLVCLALNTLGAALLISTVRVIT